jgi:hypothetical protein
MEMSAQFRTLLQKAKTEFPVPKRSRINIAQ